MIKPSLILFMVAGAIFMTNAEELRNTEMNSYKKNIENIELTVRTPKGSTSKSLANLEVTISNVGTEIVDITEHSVFPMCLITIASDSGEPVTMTPFGKGTVGPRVLLRSGVGHRKIASSQSHTWTLPLARAFELEPKSYVLTLTLLGVDRIGKVTIGSIAFSVKDE